MLHRQPSLGTFAFGDVVRVAQDVGRLSRLIVSDIAVLPGPFIPIFREHLEQTAMGSVLPDALEIVGEESLHGWSENLGHASSDELRRLISERSGSGGVDHEKPALHIVGADQAQRVIDQFAITLLAVAQRLLSLFARRDVAADSEKPGDVSLCI